MSRILITGASGQLGGYLLKVLQQRRTPAVAWSGSRTGRLFGFDLQPVELAHAGEAIEAYRRARPTLIVHAAAISRTDVCYEQPERARAVNVLGTANLAELAGQTKARLLYVSTDLVFDGRQGRYREDQPAKPVSIYGDTKLAAERAVLACPRAAVVRVSLLFGPTQVSRPGFFDNQVESLRSGRTCRLFEDEWRTPLSLLTAARSLLALAESDFEGVVHLGGPQRMSRLEMGRHLARFLGADLSVLQATKQTDVSFPEPRPRDVSLDSTQFRRSFPDEPWPEFEEALREMGL
jgi:dTDP-4-dehydrorhamnose reductase